MVGQALHRARFARHTEVWPLLSSSFATDAMLLGTRRWLLSKPLVTVRKTKHRPELGNLLIVAPTRSGKSLLAVSQLLTWHHSVIVNDIKGDLFTQTAGFRSLVGPVYVLDPTGVGHQYDPLQSKTTEDQLYSAATRLLFKPNERDPIFTKRTIKMLTQLLLASRIEQHPPLPYVRQVIRLGLPDAAERLQAISPDIAKQFLSASFERVDFNNNRFLISCWESLAADMEPLLTETVVRTFAGATFTAEQLVCSEKPITVYLHWPEQDLLALAPLVRLLWGSLIDELVTAYDQRAGKGCNPVMLLSDEAGRTAIPSLADHATTVVGRGISLWLAVQSLSQLEVVYGRERAQVLRDNMESQLYYRPTDIATADYIERRCGRQSAYAHTTTEQKNGHVSEGRSEQAIPLLSAHDFLRYQDHEVIGFHRALPPFKLERMDWRQHPILQKRRTVPAPQLSTLAPLADLPMLQGIDRTAYINPDR
jgi:type IV secretion system protein VirD4